MYSLFSKIPKILLVVFIVVFLSGCSSDSNLSSSGSISDSYKSSQENIISRYDAIADYWDEIQEYLDGTEEIEACSDSGCYDLEADISDGYITTLYFNNGGYLDFYAGIDNSGYAYDSDDELNDWEFSISMNSYFVDNAIEEWASDNDFELE